jgi:hypothetical protein
MMSMSNNDWCGKIERSIASHNLKTILDDFTESEWNSFIRMLIREELPFSIPEFAFDSPIVCFIPVFENLDKNSHKLIGHVIKQLLECLLLEDSSLNIQEDSINALFIAYAVPIYIGDEDKDIRLLKNIALKPNIKSEIRTYSARLVANYSSVIDMSFWNELMETDYESTLAPIVIGLLSKESSKLAVDFLKNLKEPLPVDNIANFEISIRRLLEKIIERKEGQSFLLNSFPNWSFDYIERLVEIDRFNELDNQWIRSDRGQDTLIEYILGKTIRNKTKLPPKDYPDYFEDDEIAKNIFRFLSSSDIYRILIIGENKHGTDVTSRAASIGYHYEKFDKNVFNLIIFIGSNVINLDEMLLVIKDCLSDESIKNYSSKDENIANVIKSFEKLHGIDQKKALIIIDDFHQKHREQQKAIGDFIKKIEMFCKVIITIEDEKEELQKILDYNSDLIPNSEKIHIYPREKTLNKEQQSDQEKKEEFVTQCYIGNPLAIKLALATTSKLISCPLPQEDKDPVWYSFQESFKELDDSSKELLIAISIFYKSEIFHDLSLYQEALEYIVSNKTDKAQAEDAIKRLRRLELISSSDKLNNFSSITIADSICRCTLRLENLQDTEEREERENTIFSRLTEYYIEFVEIHGGSDWNNRDNFEKIEVEWYNILAILEWNKRNHNFDKVKTIWIKVNRLADLYGHWEDRIKWLDVLIDHYKKHDDVDTYARCLSSKGWTLTMFGGDGFYQEAQEILKEAWKLEGVDSWLRSYIAHNLTVLYYRRGKNYFGKAKDMIAEQEVLYNINQNLLPAKDKRELKRLSINNLRDKAKIEFLEGNYLDAHEKYLNCLEMSQEIDWVRMTSYFNYMLAATLLKQTESTVDSEKLDRILGYIAEGVYIAKNNNSRRRLAYFKELYASLLRQKGDSRTEDWDKKAKDDIKRLGLKDSSYNLTTGLN